MNKKLLTALASDSDPPMFSFQKFYVNGTKATNFSPVKGAFGIPTLQLKTVSWAPEWGLDLDYDFEGMDELIPNRPPPISFKYGLRDGKDLGYLILVLGTVKYGLNLMLNLMVDGNQVIIISGGYYTVRGKILNHLRNGQSSVNCDYQNKRRHKRLLFCYLLIVINPLG